MRLTDEQGKVLGVLLPNHISKETAISGPYWCSVLWPDIPGDKALHQLGAHLSRIRRKLPGTGLSIPIVKPDGSGRGSKYYLEIGPVPEPAEPPVPPPAPAEAAQLVPAETAPAAPIEDNFWIPTLTSIVREKKRKKLTNQVLHNMSNTDPAILTILAEYLQSQDLYPLLNDCVQFNTKLERPPVGVDREILTEMFYRHASGHANEWLFYRIFYPVYLQQGLFILSPLQKFILYRNAHPEKRIVAEDISGLNPEIEGVSSPDNLIIKPLPQEEPEFLEVISVVECKAVTSSEHRVRKYIQQQRADYTVDNVAHHLRLNDLKHYPEMPARLGRLLNRLNGGLPALPLRVSKDMTVVYAVPRGGSRLPIENIQPQEIPITTSAIAGFLRELTRAL